MEPSSPNPSPSEPEGEAFFRHLELQRAAALVARDLPLLEALHAPEYQLVTPSGRVFERQRYLDAIAREPFYAGWEAGEMAFRISPAMAIVRYPATLRFPSGRVVQCWHTDAYEKRGGRWQAVWSQATELRPPPAPAEAPAAAAASTPLHHVELYVADLERSVAFWTPFTALLGYEAERWTGGMNYVRGAAEPYLCLLPAAAEHLGAGYHRKRVGLNHLAFRGRSRPHVDEVAAWVKAAGHRLLYEDRHPYAGGAGYYAMYCEDPDRMKLEVVAP